jgi:hypothetical protein
MSIVTLGKVHTGDAGTEFQLQVLETGAGNVTQPVDLTGTTVEMIFTDPSGVETSFPATVSGDPVNGVITFTNIDTTFFNDDSYWFNRVKVTDGANVFASNDAAFEVLGSQQ